MPWCDLDSGGRLWYENVGNGPAIVLLHGWCMSSAVWQFQLERLSSSFRLIAPDLRGHGQSLGLRGDYNFSGFCADVAELFVSLDIRDAVLAGWSMGAQVALAVCALIRERLAGLVLVSGTPRFVAADDYPHGLDAHEVAGMEVSLRRNTAKTLERFAADMFAEGELGTCDRSGRIHHLLQTIRFPERNVAVESLRDLGAADMRGILADIDLPVLIVNGDMDRICLPGASAYMNQQLGTSDHVVYKGCGHAPFLTRCDEFNDTIAGFCGRIFAGEVKKGRVEKRFHRRAGAYDQYAVVQKIVVEKLSRLVASNCPRPPHKALDIGCGTGAMLSALHKLYPDAGLWGLDPASNMLARSSERLSSAAVLIRGEAESLPFGDGSFDLVVSSSTFQWVQNLDVCLQECRRVLKQGGLLCAAFFGERTLWELRESYRQALEERYCAGDSRIGRLRRFRQSDEVKKMLALAGFGGIAVTVETEVEYHPDVTALLRSIRNIGATTPASDAGGGLGWRGVLNAMSQIYQSRFQVNGMIPATYDVIYMVGRLQP